MEVMELWSWMSCKKRIGILVLLAAGMLGIGCGVNEVEKEVENETEQSVLMDTEDSAVYGVVDLTSYVTLGEYEGVAVEKIEPQEVTEEEVAHHVKQLFVSVSERKEVEDGIIKKGDYAVVSFQGYLDDVKVEDAQLDDMTLQIGEYVMLPDFEDGLIGAKKGDILTIDVHIPKDYDEEYAGQTMEYDVKISEVYTVEIPELTDANVKKYFHLETVKDLEDETRLNLEKRYEEDAINAMNEAAMNTVIMNADIREYPKKYLNQFMEQVRKGYEQDAASKDMLFADYIEQMQLSEQEFEKQVQEIAKVNLASEMVYQAIIKAENLTLTEEEMKKGAEIYVDGMTYRSVDEVMEKVNEERLKQRVLYQKAYEWVASHKVVEEK